MVCCRPAEAAAPSLLFLSMLREDRRSYVNMASPELYDYINSSFPFHSHSCTHLNKLTLFSSLLTNMCISSDVWAGCAINSTKVANIQWHCSYSLIRLIIIMTQIKCNNEFQTGLTCAPLVYMPGERSTYISVSEMVIAILTFCFVLFQFSQRPMCQCKLCIVVKIDNKLFPSCVYSESVHCYLNLGSY